MRSAGSAVRGAAPALTWRAIRDPARPGARNMALDHALAASLGEGEAVLRLYGWIRPTASFGRNEPARGRYSAEAAERLGIDLVRRPTGGRVVLHDQEITYAVVSGARAFGGAREAYRRINEALARALASLGADVAVSEEGGEPGSSAPPDVRLGSAAATPGATPPLEAGPCFQSPVAGEVTARGRKLVGSAQARVDGALLQHGSIILAGDQRRLEALRVADPPANHGPAAAPASTDRPASLTELLGPVDPTMIIDAIVDAMHRTFGGEWVDGGFTDDELERADRLMSERYGRSEWTWRR